jgi:hypothetical protein
VAELVPLSSKPADYLSCKPALPLSLQKLMSLKKSPMTGNTHILMQMDPYINQKIRPADQQNKKPSSDEYSYLHMGEKVRFFKGYNELQIKEEHYQQCFIAKDVEELRQNPNTRKELQKYTKDRAERGEIKEESLLITSESEEEPEAQQKSPTS